MALKSKQFTALLIVLGCLAIVGGIKVFKGKGPALFKMSNDAKMKGDHNAPLKVTEFIDFQCPACAMGSKYLSEMFVKYPGLIRLQLKYFPLQMHKHGMISALYAECAAAQEKFWDFQDLLIDRQSNWSRLDDAAPAFDQIAKEVQLDSGALEACLEGDSANREIEKNRAEGQSLGIRSTPTYFINGKMVVGMKSLEMEIKKYLDENSD